MHFKNNQLNYKQLKLNFMKKQFLTIVILMCSIVIFTASCGKKEKDVILDITMSYTPNPATKDTTVQFTFDVKDKDKYQAVEMTSCEVIKGSMKMDMPITEKMAGQYTGQKIFTETGTFEIHFNYMDMNEKMTDKDFSITVQ